MKDLLNSILSLIARPAVSLGGAVVIGVALVAYTFVSTSVAPSGATVLVTQGAITQEVDVSGTVKAAQRTDLAFQVPGRVSAIRVQVGDHVTAGETLVSLDGATEAAALAQAQAALEVQEAQLASLKSGTRPEQLSIDVANLQQARAALDDALQNAYVAADDAVHAKADELFTNPRTAGAALAFTAPDATRATAVTNERIALQQVFSAWQSLSASSTDPVATAGVVNGYLVQVNAFLNDLATLLAETPAGGSLTAAELTAYQASVNAARSEITGSLTGALPGLTGALTGYKSAQGALTLAQAGATPDQIAAQQAAVDAAQAAVTSAQVAVDKTVLVAPIAGTITVQNANPGETVTPGAPIVSLIADGKYEAVANVSDNDIAKVKIGQEVEATFDSYPGVSFLAKVTTVDPAATMENGVPSYGVTVTFDTNDPRLSAGMTANLRIITATKDNALLVPTSAIITDGTGSFVYVRTARQYVKTPVETGLSSVSGMTEILNGVTAGQAVLTYGSNATS